MNSDFKRDFGEESEKPKFIYKRNPVLETAWQIFIYKDEKADYEPVGEYTVIDTQEDTEITEKKLMNLMRLMNGRERLIELGNLTGTRLLYNIVPDTSDDNVKIIFRTYDGAGVSQENAILIIEKGVFQDAR